MWSKTRKGTGADKSKSSTQPDSELTDKSLLVVSSACSTTNLDNATFLNDDDDNGEKSSKLNDTVMHGSKSADFICENTITKTQVGTSTSTSQKNIDKVTAFSSDSNDIADSCSSENGESNSQVDSLLIQTKSKYLNTNREDDPSINSIRGDSISATLDNVSGSNFIKTTAFSDSQSVKGRLSQGNCGDSNYSRADDLSSNVNFLPASSTSLSHGPNNSKCQRLATADFSSISSQTNIDVIDLADNREGSSTIISQDQFDSNDDAQNTVATASTTKALITTFPSQIRNKGKRNNHDKKSRRNQSRRRRQVSTITPIYDESELPSQFALYEMEPIIIRGNGNLTIFGLSNSFTADFPNVLIGKVSREEYEITMRKINNLMRGQLSLNARLLLLGCLCFCCSFGLSLVWPSIALKKKTKAAIEKLLSAENNRLYSKLGMVWKLAEQRSYSNPSFVEYVILIEFIQRKSLYVPD